MNLLDLARAGVLETPTASATDDARIDPDVTRRRAKALALLDAEPTRQIAIVAEAPKPGETVSRVCIAIRHVAVGDIAIPAEKYDLALLALMDEHAQGKLQ
jgi:hypothetical protein